MVLDNNLKTDNAKGPTSQRAQCLYVLEHLKCKQIFELKLLSPNIKSCHQAIKNMPQIFEQHFLKGIFTSQCHIIQFVKTWVGQFVTGKENDQTLLIKMTIWFYHFLSNLTKAIASRRKWRPCMVIYFRHPINFYEMFLFPNKHHCRKSLFKTINHNVLYL